MAVEFHDFSIQVKEAIKEKAIAFLYEAAGEIQSEVRRNTRKDTGKLKGDWTYKINEDDLEATIGNPQENAIWEEFGTGEYAANGDGRKGGWYIPEENLSNKAKTKMQRVVIHDKVFYHTYGKMPTHVFQKAYDGKKNFLIRRANQIFGEIT